MCLLTCVATRPQPDPPSLPARLATPTPLTAPPFRWTQLINGWCVLLKAPESGAVAAAATDRLLPAVPLRALLEDRAGQVHDRAACVAAA